MYEFLDRNLENYNSCFMCFYLFLLFEVVFVVYGMKVGWFLRLSFLNKKEFLFFLLFGVVKSLSFVKTLLALVMKYNVCVFGFMFICLVFNWMMVVGIKMCVMVMVCIILRLLGGVMFLNGVFFTGISALMGTFFGCSGSVVNIVIRFVWFDFFLFKLRILL